MNRSFARRRLTFNVAVITRHPLPGTGAHTSALDLLHQVEDVQADYQRTTANVPAGNLIGPFTAGQVVRVRTDVGNSRDHSEMSAEQVVTIAPVP